MDYEHSREEMQQILDAAEASARTELRRKVDAGEVSRDAVIAVCKWLFGHLSKFGIGRTLTLVKDVASGDLTALLEDVLEKK